MTPWQPLSRGDNPIHSRLAAKTGSDQGTRERRLKWVTCAAPRDCIGNIPMSATIKEKPTATTANLTGHYTGFPRRRR